MNDRGSYGQGPVFRGSPRMAPRVGELSTIQAMLMTPGAIAAELGRIDLAFESFHRDMMDALRAAGDNAPIHGPVTDAPAEHVAYVMALNARGSAVANKPIVKFVRDQWLPLYQAWKTFFTKEREGSWWHNAAYDAEKYEAQLADLRAVAQSLGTRLLSVSPQSEHAADSGWKWALGGAVVLAGVWGAVEITKAVRGK